VKEEETNNRRAEKRKGKRKQRYEKEDMVTGAKRKWYSEKKVKERVRRY